MPRIPLKTANIDLPSQVGRAGTGLRQASENIGAGKYGAMADIGRAIGDIGELIFQKKIQQDAQDRNLGEDELDLKLQTDVGQIVSSVNEAQTPEEILSIWDKVTEVDPVTNKRTLKGFHTFGNDLSKIDTTDNPVLNKFKGLGFTEEGKAKWDVRRASYLNRVEEAISKKVADARFNIFKEKKGLIDQKITENVLSGLIPFEDGIIATVINYSDNGQSESVNKPLREAAVQALTIKHLDAEFEAGNMEVIDAYLRGDYRDELVDVFKDDENILAEFESKALMAKGKIIYDPDNPEFMKDGVRNYNLVAAAIKKDKQLGQVERDQLLTRANVLINRRNSADAKELLQRQIDLNNTLSNLQMEGRTEEVLDFINNDMRGAFEDSEINKMLATIREGNDPYKESDPDQVQLIESYFFYLNENPDDVDMDSLSAVIETSWGKGRDGGINGPQRKEFLSRWRAIDKERDKKADPLNGDAYRFAEKELWKWYENKGFRTKEMTERKRESDVLAVKAEGKGLTNDESKRWQELEGLMREDVRQQKRTMQGHLEGLKKETIDKKDPKLYFENNIKPIIEAGKKEQVKDWLDGWFSKMFSVGNITQQRQSIMGTTGGAEENLFSQENLEYTAKEENMTVEEVKKLLGIE